MGELSIVKPFHFSGRIPASKSILNRLLVIRSYFPELKIVGESKADDVVKMATALKQLERGEPADCGAAGTTFRFLALKAARMGGTHHLSGSLRLFERPHAEISKVLSQLGIEAEFGRQRLTVRGQGWKEPGQPVIVDRSLSSQFASSVLLNAWNLPFDFTMRMEGDFLSDSYFRMTTKLVTDLGMKLEIDGNDCKVPRYSKINVDQSVAESDVSSAFSIAAVAAATKGMVEFIDWPENSLQPDLAFVSILEKMGCAVESTKTNSSTTLKISGPETLKAGEWNLRDSPDLFPVLGVLCALAPGKSKLLGAPQLAHKESNRLTKTGELIGLMGRKVKIHNDGIEIDGPIQRSSSQFLYDTDHDHRLAMAAAVAISAGFPIRLTETKVVTKSFPEFWDIIGSSVEIR